MAWAASRAAISSFIEACTARDITSFFRPLNRALRQRVTRAWVVHRTLPTFGQVSTFSGWLDTTSQI